MNTDFEQLVRGSMEWFAADLEIPADLAGRARQAHQRRRRLAVRTALACGTAAVTAAAVIVVAGAVSRPGTGGATNAQATAYVIKRVQKAVAAANFVIQDRATGTDGPTSSWTYGSKTRTVEFTGSDCGYMLPNRTCSGRGGSKPALAWGTARIGGKLVGAYVTYYDHRYSLSALGHYHLNACSAATQLVLGGPAVTMPDWPGFLKAMLACQHATVTGHARIGGRETIVISGLIDVPLSKGYGRTVQEKRVRVRYALDVDPATYLPVRMSGSTETYGGAAGPTTYASVTNVQWLPPTPSNIARALVTIPPGYQHWMGSRANQ